MLGHAQALSSGTRSSSRASTHVRAASLLALFLAGSLVAGWWSPGVYHEDDLTHYLFARWSHFDSRFLVDWWGRPGFTVPYSWPAAAGSSVDGLQACRVFSAVLSAATAWLVYCIVRNAGARRAWIAVPLLFLQPLFAKLSLTTLTETPLAFYFALSSWLLIKDRLEWSAAVMALAPVTRDEAVVILPLWVLAIWLRNGRWWCYPLLLWAVVAHNLVSAAALDAWPITRWLRPDGVDHYGQGTLLTFVPKVAFASGPVVVAAALLGAGRIWKRPLGWLWVLAPLTWFAAETFIYLRGAYSSGGYARFLVPMCPWLAVLAAYGAQPLFVRRVRSRTMAALGLAMAALFVLCEGEWIRRNPVRQPDWQVWSAAGRVGLAVLSVVLLICALRLRRAGRGSSPAATAVLCVVTIGFLAAGAAGFAPLRLNKHQRYLREYAPAVSRFLQEDRPVVALSCWLHFWTDRPVAWTNSQELPKRVLQARPGTILMWDKRSYLDPVPLFDYGKLAGGPDWRLLWSSGPDGDDPVPHLACFERQGRLEVAQPTDGSQPD